MIRGIKRLKRSTSKLLAIRFSSLWIAPICAPLFVLGCSGSSWDETDTQLANATAISDARLVTVEGTKNFRDLGGYETADGKFVKKGMLYRSDSLAHLEETGQKALTELNVKTVTDLRSKTERDQEPNNLPLGKSAPKYQVLPVTKLSIDIREIGRKVAEGELSDEEASDLLDLRRYIENPAIREHWSSWIRSLASAKNTPHLYHCTSGKDRTGIASALLLMTLGVPKETIMEDYLFSNTVLKPYNQATIDKISWLIWDDEKLAIIEKIMGVQRQTLEDAFSLIETEFGSTDDFVRNGLNIEDDTREKLRAKFLTQ